MIYRLTFIFILLVSFLGCKENLPPQPTDTFVKMDMEEGDKKTERNRYIELVHGGPDVDWRSIEAENAKALLDYKRKLRSLNGKRAEEEWVADGLLKGKWIERGSYNLAGNITTTAYDLENDIIYCLGGGGPIFKGNRFGFPWTLVNDDFRFTRGMLELIHNQDGDMRMIAAINFIPHYSDDEGETWELATGLVNQGNADIYDVEITSEEEIFFLHKKDYWSNINLYKSISFGESYERIYGFSTSDKRNVSMAKSIDSDDIYVIEQLSESSSRLYKYVSSSNTLEIEQVQMPIAFGTDGRANLNIREEGVLQLFLYDEENRYQTSKDTGLTWEVVGTLPSRPWEVGVFMPPSNPDKLIYGEVNAHRSQSGGEYWIKINDWWEYYSNIEFKLHADIMSLDEYYTAAGSPFILIGNHGGISITEDYGETNTNIGMFGLNVGQFYDVATYPYNTKRMFGGTQDQGLQKGKMRGEDPDDFIQIISGDYGHIKYTGPEGKHLWTVYPGGSISFYYDPLTQTGPSFGYEIKSENETVWIPPIIPSADPEKDIIYAAGGSADESSDGSFIIKLDATSGSIVATDLPFDFAESGGQISTMAISPHDPNIWFVATTNGYLYRSLDNAQTFELIRKSVAGAHYLYGSCILPSKLDPNVVYLSGNGYNATSPVYRSIDGGESFQAMGKGLPKTTAFKLAANGDESLLFAATEAGPYVWIEEEQAWYSLVGELTPNQTYWSVEFVEELNIARFGTYGRGIWDFEVTSQTPTTAEFVEAQIDIVAYPNPSNGLLTVIVDHINSYKINIVDMTGRVQNHRLTYESDDRAIIDIQDLPSGNYFIQFSNGTSQIKKKIVKV